MDITQQQVEHLSRLARLSLTHQEREELTGQLEQMVSYMQVLAQVDGGDVQGGEKPGALRHDEVEPSLVGDKLLRQAPRVAEGYVATPSSVGEGGEA